LAPVSTSLTSGSILSSSGAVSSNGTIYVAWASVATDTYPSWSLAQNETVTATIAAFAA
jgi:hypothetical protein